MKRNDAIHLLGVVADIAARMPEDGEMTIHVAKTGNGSISLDRASFERVFAGQQVEQKTFKTHTSKTGYLFVVERGVNVFHHFPMELNGDSGDVEHTELVTMGEAKCQN